MYTALQLAMNVQRERMPQLSACLEKTGLYGIGRCLYKWGLQPLKYITK